MLTKSPKISDLTKTNFFQVILSQIIGTVVQKWCRADLSSGWDLLTR